VHGVWFIKMVWEISEWCMVCIGKGVEIRVVLMCEKTDNDVNYEVR
jgi:hypothetical protein